MKLSLNNKSAQDELLNIHRRTETASFYLFQDVKGIIITTTFYVSFLTDGD